MESFFRFFLYPFYYLVSNIFNPLHSTGKKIGSVFFALFILLPFWIIEIGAVVLSVWFILQFAGIAYVKVPVQGASMLPTLPIEGNIEFKRYPTIEQLKPVIKKGDLVVFENEKTRDELKKEGKDSTGFVKRVVAVGGDRVTLRDGFVYVNDILVEEPYILKPRSTFGGEQISDCQQIQVPPNQVFVLGDNRKLSMDSRHIGLVSTNDLNFYRPIAEQQVFANKWRDASQDKNIAHTSTFDINKYLELLNKERVKAGLEPLQHQPKLGISAKLRAEAMLKYDDLSFEATRSAYPMKRSLQDAGYSNIVYGEFPMLGYYDADELYESFFEFNNTREFLLNKEYEEIGLSTFIGDLHGCPVQIVVQHLAGYIPPNYDQSIIGSWKQLSERLKSVQPTWLRLKGYGEFYDKNKADVDRINEVIALRLSRAEAVVKRMEANEWLNDEEKKFTEEDDKLHEEQSQLAEKLNASNN